MVGRLEEDIGEEIALLEWRRRNLFTYDLAKRARDQHSSIYSEWVPSVRYLCDDLLPHAERPNSEEVEAGRKRADKQARAELAGAIELVDLGDVATLEYLEKQLAIRDRLDAMIARLYKKLAYVRAIKSMSPPSLPVPSPPLLELERSVDREH